MPIIDDKDVDHLQFQSTSDSAVILKMYDNARLYRTRKKTNPENNLPDVWQTSYIPHSIDLDFR